MKISVAMITMNEEKNIVRALSSCSFADEIVVVDGGSTDSTLDILKANDKVKLVQRPWDDHFSRQRQASLDHCSGDWVIRLDSDEAFSLVFENNIREYFSSTSNDINACRVRQCNLIGNENYYSKTFDDFEKAPRMWRNSPGLKWDGSIHEVLTGLMGKVSYLEVYVVHYGFLDKKKYREKGEYYSRLPESGFNKAEQLLYREYDIQPRPLESAVAKHVPENFLELEGSMKGEIAIVGNCLNALKWHELQELPEKYNLTLLIDEVSNIDYSLADLHAIKLPQDEVNSGELLGLEFELFDKDIFCTEGIASTYTYQAILAKLKFGKKLLTVIKPGVPLIGEVTDDTQAIKAIAAQYVDIFIVSSELAGKSLLQEGVSAEKIKIIPQIENEPLIEVRHLNELLDNLFMSTFKGAIAELSEYIKLTEQDTLKRIRSVYSQQLQEWGSTIGSNLTENKVTEYYSQTDSYLFDLVQFNYENIHYVQWIEDIFNFCSRINDEHNGVEIMDFGGGIGSQIIKLSCIKEAGMTYADIPGNTFDYAKWRFGKRGLDIKFIDATKENFLEERMYDIVISLDVVEHLVNPEETVEYLINHIKPDGYFVVSTSFLDNNGEAGWHLNVDKYTDEGFYSLIRSLGMEMMNEGLPRIFRKDSELSTLVGKIKSAKNENRPEEARKYMETYIELRPVDLNMQLKYAELCYLLDDREAAMTSLNKIMLFNPDLPDARILADKINKEKKEVLNSSVNEGGSGIPKNEALVIQESKVKRYGKKEGHEVKMADLVPDNAQRILHLGCKDGELGKVLLSRGAEKVIGVNSDSTTCEKARNNITDVICGNIEEINLPYDKGYFDCIIIDNILEYLNDPLYVLKELKDYLSDTGEVVAVIPNTGNIFKINKLVDGQWNSDGINNSDNISLRFYTRKEIEKLFAEADLELSGLSSGLMSPEYHEIDVTASQDISVGRILLKNLNPEELRDMYTMNYVIKARKKGSELIELNTLIESYMTQGKMAEAKQAIEEYLELHLADANALLLHAEVCCKLHFYDSAMESLDKILLFDPGREDVRKLKHRIEQSGTTACLE